MVPPPPLEQHRDVCLHESEQCDDIDGPYPAEPAKDSIAIFRHAYMEIQCLAGLVAMPRRSQTYHVQLTVNERDTLLAYVDPEGVLDDVFANARVVGPLVNLELRADQLNELFQYLEATARFAQNESAMDLLARVFARLEAGLAGTADPGWHMLRPAITRESFTMKQGQYLAFIHLYTRLHRRAPSHADIQEYFRTSPPVVNETLKALQRGGFIARDPGTARSIRVLVPAHAIPELE